MGGDLVPQLRDALRGSIFVEPLSDPCDAFLFKRFRDIKIGFADAQMIGSFIWRARSKIRLTPEG